MSVAEQTALIRKLLSSQPNNWVAVNGLMLSYTKVGYHNTSTEEDVPFAIPVSRCFTNLYGGFTTQDHNGASQTFNFAPMEFDVPSITGNMDAEFQLKVYDLNQDGESNGSNISVMTMLQEIEEAQTVLGIKILPKLVILTFIAYEDFTISPYCDGPYEFDVTNIDFSEAGAAITAKCPDAIYASCGMTYNIKDFKMLKQFL